MKASNPDRRYYVTIANPSPNNKTKESLFVSITATVIAGALVLLCFWASQWQYHRGIDRHHRNYVISTHVALPSLPLASVLQNIHDAEWRTVSTTGVFDSGHHILLRNRYTDGKYGYDLLTLFHDDQGITYWIDRGWIAPGATALAKPNLPPTKTATLQITGRVRLQQSLPQGSFFAISKSGNGDLISKWNAQSNTQVKTEVFYLDLLTTSESTMNPAVPVVLPELTDGPHMAYALQWLFFAGLVIYGRFLLRRSR